MPVTSVVATRLQALTPEKKCHFERNGKVQNSFLNAFIATFVENIFMAKVRFGIEQG